MAEVETRKMVIDAMMGDYTMEMCDEISAERLQVMHADVRIGGISLQQVRAAIAYVCVGDSCDAEELFDVLTEMDRRYFLLQDFVWEFTLLDYGRKDSITEAQAKWLVMMVHGNLFSRSRWETFLRLRAIPASGVSFSEIEVTLCDVPAVDDLVEEMAELHREEEERARRQREVVAAAEKERQRRLVEQERTRKRAAAAEEKRKKQEQKRRKEEEAARLRQKKENEEAEKRRRRLEEEEERGARQAQAQWHEEIEDDPVVESERVAAEAAHKDEMEKQKTEEDDAASCENMYQQAMKNEVAAAAEAADHLKRSKDTKDVNLKKASVEAEQRARLKAKEHRHRKIRYNLKAAIKKRDRIRLPPAVGQFKAAKLPDDDHDLPKAERILKEFKVADNLRRAMTTRQLADLEAAVASVRRAGLEPQLHHELLAAHAVLSQLRRLERIRAEILELKQATVAEIRSYQKPPAVVHVVMTATFLLLGHHEKETKIWKHVQALVGKTGKEGLKRGCLQCDPGKIKTEAAARAQHLLSAFNLEEVRDVSAGAATFYVWSMTMIEEKQLRVEAVEREKGEKLRAVAERKRLQAADAKRKKEEAVIAAEASAEAAANIAEANRIEDARRLAEAEAAEAGAAEAAAAGVGENGAAETSKEAGAGE